MLDYPSKSVSPDPDVQKRFDRARLLMQNEQVDDEMLDLLRDNVRANCTSSMVTLGDLLVNGTDAERRESIKLFETAAEAGDSSAMRNLGYCLAVGLNCGQDKEEAAKWYRRAAEAGNARAMCNLGVLYAFGHGVPLEPETAFSWYLRSAEGGCTRGMTNVGEMYLQGVGTVPADADEAERWFRASGSPRAYYHLAEMYLDGLGRPKDPETGRLFLQQSAYGSYTRALYRLGTLYEANDLPSAQRCYSEAAKKGNRDAVDRLLELGMPIPKRTPMRRKKTVEES